MKNLELPAHQAILLPLSKTVALCTEMVHKLINIKSSR